MFNLLVGLPQSGSVSTDRFVRTSEYTEQQVVDALRGDDGEVDLKAILRLRALRMPEVTDKSAEQVAEVGRIHRLRQSGTTYNYTFAPDPEFGPIPTETIAAHPALFGVDSDWELSRTHWAVKDEDLDRALAAAMSTASADSQPSSGLAPRVFTLDNTRPVKDDLVAVMMPFGAEFDRVFEAIREAVDDAGLDCQRADDPRRWNDERVMQDIVDLIWDARFTVADFTDRNPNVFYEVGIAHTIGRRVVPLAQHKTDIPFDVASNRYIRYLPNAEGLSHLRTELAERLRTLRREHRDGRRR